MRDRKNTSAFRRPSWLNASFAVVWSVDTRRFASWRKPATWLLLCALLLLPPPAPGAMGSARSALRRCYDEISRLVVAPLAHLPPPPVARPSPVLVSRIEALTGHKFDPSRFSAEWFRAHFDGRKGTEGVDEARQLRLSYGRRRVGEADLYRQKQTLRFDIEIRPDYRGTKLYQYLMEAALREFPNVTRLPARMHYSRSDNAVAFIDKAFGGRKAFQNLDALSLSKEEALALRRKLVSDLADMPAIKIRQRCGFGRITKVILNPREGAFAFDVEKGERLPLGSVKIYVDGKSPVRLSAAGTLLPVKDPRELALTDYPDFDPW